MIQKVLIAEDYQSVNLSVQHTLEAMGIPSPDYVAYCDDAILRIKKALQQQASYDLLITDLHFEPDHRQQDIKNGEELVSQARSLQPDLKIIVFSATGKPDTIDRLLKEHLADGYVCKGRHDAVELQDAIRLVGQNQQYFPRQHQQHFRQKKAHNFTLFDLAIIGQLAAGTRQKDIPVFLEQHKIRPSGLSSIEKRLSLIREIYEFSTNEQLVAFCKDKGIL